MNKKIFLILILALSICDVSFAQKEDDSVKLVINKLFIAMKSSNALMLKECFADSAIMQTIALNKQGKLFVRNENVPAFIESIGKLPKDSADERIVFDAIKIEGVLANVWTPYRFYYNNQFTHCGVDNFILVKLSGGWKIQYLIDTRRKHGCEVNE